MLPRGPRVRRRLNAAAFAGGFGAPRRSSGRTTPSGGGSSQSTPRNPWAFLLCGLRGRCVERDWFTSSELKDCATTGLCKTALVKDAGPPDGFGRETIVGDDGPQRLVEEFAVAEQGSTQEPLLHGAQFPKCAVAPAVPERGAGLHTVHADDVEREIEDQSRTVEEHPGAPELVRDREAPFRSAKCRLERSHLEQTNRAIRSLRHHGKADVLPGLTLSMRPRDELFEALHRMGRGRDEPRHFHASERGKQRGRIAQAQLAKRHERSGEGRQSTAPIKSDRRGNRRRYRRQHGFELRMVRHLLHQNISPMMEAVATTCRAVAAKKARWGVGGMACRRAKRWPGLS